MPRKRTERKVGKVSADKMKAALDKIQSKELSVRKASIAFEIPYATLQRYANKMVNGILQRYSPNYEVNRVFTDAEEKELYDYIIFASKIFHGLTKQQVKNLAYELAVKNNKKFSNTWKDNEEANEEWLRGFRARHLKIALRSPEQTSLARVTAFNKTSVSEFFQNVTKAYNKLSACLSPSMIYNLDETCLMTVSKPPKVLAEKGVKRCGQVVSAERGTLVTACCIICADGSSVPPFLVFPRAKFIPSMISNAPSGSAGSVTKNGWSNGRVFLEILAHFKRTVRCTKETPVILFIDNHESHLTIDALNFCKDNGIMIVTFPPHTTNRLQPLDTSVFKSLKSRFASESNNWLLCHPGHTISIHDVGHLLGKSYDKVFTPSNIKNGFKSTGIWPFSPEVFDDEDFAGSYVSDRPPPQLQMGENPENPSFPVASRPRPTRFNYGHCKIATSMEATTRSNTIGLLGLQFYKVHIN